MSTAAPTVGRVAKSDLAAVLSVAATAKADVVEMRPDRTLRFLGAAGDLAVHLPFPGRGWDGEARWVDRRKLARVVKACSDNVTVESVDKGLRLRFRSTMVDLPEQPRPRTYLDVNNDAERRELFAMDAAELGRLLGTAAPFATPDETRPVINAVALDLAGGKVVATDSYRLAILDAPGLQVSNAETVAVALGGVRLLAAALARAAGSVNVYRGARGIVFTFDGQTWAASDREGAYPDWRKLLPDPAEPGTVPVATFEVDAREVVKASSLIRDLQFCHEPMTVNVSPSSVVAAARGRSTKAEVRLDAAVDAAPPGVTTVGVDPEFLRSIARAVGTGRARVSIIDPMRPVLVNGPGAQYLLMPIRLSS